MKSLNGVFSCFLCVLENLSSRSARARPLMGRSSLMRTISDTSMDSDDDDVDQQDQVQIIKLQKGPKGLGIQLVDGMVDI